MSRRFARCRCSSDAGRFVAIGPFYPLVLFGVESIIKAQLRAPHNFATTSPHLRPTSPQLLPTSPRLCQPVHPDAGDRGDSSLYQFWPHRRLIGPLGILDRSIQTPSNHRVHHAQNDTYLDRNYGGVFLLWDRLFGTFQEERDEEPCIYGVRGQLKSWNPVWPNLHYWWLMAARCSAQSLPAQRVPRRASECRVPGAPPESRTGGGLTRVRSCYTLTTVERNRG